MFEESQENNNENAPDGLRKDKVTPNACKSH